MLKVALTGGIATGKSYVLDRLRARGVPCLDADVLSHEAFNPGTGVTRAVARRFGDGVLDAQGGVDRTVLGPIVFADPSARRDLEAIVHPAVYRAIADGLRALETAGQASVAVVDVPLLYETGRAGDFDAVVATMCPRPIQRARLMARGLTAGDADQRLDAQWPADQKAARADFVITTAGTSAHSGICRKRRTNSAPSITGIL